MKKIQSIVFIMCAILAGIAPWITTSTSWKVILLLVILLLLVVLYFLFKLEFKWRKEGIEEKWQDKVEQVEKQVEALNNELLFTRQQCEAISILPTMVMDDSDDSFNQNIHLIEEFFNRVVPAQHKDEYAHYFFQVRNAREALNVLRECRVSLVKPFFEALKKEDVPLTEEHKQELLGRLIDLAMACIDLAENRVFYTEKQLTPYVAIFRGLKDRKETISEAKEITNYPDTTPRDARIIKVLLSELNYKAEQTTYFGYKLNGKN